MKLTQRSIQQLPAPSQGQRFVWDDQLKGYGVRVTPTARTFILDRKLAGRTVRLSIGRVGEWTEDQARRQARKLIVDLDSGIDPREQRLQQATQGVTLQQAFDRFVQERELKASTLTDYRRFLQPPKDKQKTPFFHDWARTPLTQISANMVLHRYQRLCAGTRGKAQASLAMRMLRSLFNFAIAAYDLTLTNPVETLTKRKVWVRANQRDRVLLPSQIPAFLKALRAHPNPVIAAYLEFILHTGARRSEAARLRWADVDLRNKALTFPDTKNGRPRTIPITPTIEALLRKMQALKDGPYVFASRDKQGRPSYVKEPRTVLAHANQAAGSRVTVHDLRRTYSTLLESLDCPLIPLKALMGHSLKSDVTTRHYVVLTIDRLRPWADRLEQHLQTLAAMPHQQPEY